MTDSLEFALEERLLARSQVSPREVDALRVFARTLPARRSFWRGPVMQWSLAAAALVLAATVALPMLFRVPGFGGDPTPPATPTPVPTQPAPSPTVGPSVPAPTPDLALGPIRLAVASGSVVDVDIDDPRRILTGAVAEQANPGMSFAWLNSSVDDLGDGRYRVTWVGYPRDEEVLLEVSETESGGVLLHFIQAAPLPNTDGEGEDRVMVIELAEPIDASDIEVTFDYPA
jgi:hypothetical protein